MLFPDKPKDQRPESDSAEQKVFEGFITETEYARQRGVSVRTCQRDRALRQAPPYVILGKRIYYRVDAIRAWLGAQERSADRQTAGRRRT